MKARARLAALATIAWSATAAASLLRAQTSGTATWEGFEGRNVSKVEVAIAPEKDAALAKQLIVQKEGTPLSRDAVLKSAAALREHEEFRDVQVSIEPDQKGVRLVFLIQPVYRVGLVTFPGAAERVTYTRLLQAVDFSPDETYIAEELPRRERALEKFLAQQGYFEANVGVEAISNSEHQIVNLVFHCALGPRARVGEIDVVGVGSKEAKDVQETLRSLWAKLSGSALKTGQKYSEAKVNKALDHVRAHLAKTGRLAPRVEATPKYDEDTKRADLILTVAPGPLVTVQVEGGHVWKRTLRKLIPIYQENALDKDLIEEGRRNLLSYFQGKSYFDASVTANEKEEPGRVTITYTVDRGKKHRVDHILFTNNNNFSDSELNEAIAVKKSRFPFYRGKYSEALLKKSVNSITSLYHREGFASARVTTNVTDADPRVDVEFVIEEGPQDLVRKLEIVDEQGRTVRPSLGKRKIQLTPGMPYSRFYMNKDRDRIVASYLNRGYPEAAMEASAKPHAAGSHEFDVTYAITPGRLVLTKDVVLLGPKQTQRGFVQTIVHENVRAGQPLSQEKQLRSESDLYSLGIFDWASVSALDASVTPNQQEVLVRVHESKRNSLDFGGGLEVIPRNGNLPVGAVALPGLPGVSLGSKFTVSQKSFVGPRVTAQFARHNIFGRAETAAIGVVLSRLDQRAALTYADPDFKGTRWSSLFSVTAERTTANPIFTARTGQASFQVETHLDKRKTQRLVTRYSYSRTDLTNLLIPDLVLPQDRKVKLSSVSAEYIRDTRDSALDAHRGEFESLSFTINPTAFGSSANFVKFLGQASFYRPIKPWLTWANNFRVGAAPPFAGSFVPLSERFFSGGPSTLRGFAINGAGPQRPVQVCGNPADASTCTLISVPVGGEMLGIVNSEARFPIPVKKNLGGVVFYDGGNVYNNINFRQLVDNYTNTVGVGLRYNTKVGPVRFDIARRLTGIPGVKATQFFITLGQSF